MTGVEYRLRLRTEVDLQNSQISHEVLHLLHVRGQTELVRRGANYVLLVVVVHIDKHVVELSGSLLSHLLQNLHGLSEDHLDVLRQLEVRPGNLALKPSIEGPTDTRADSLSTTVI